MSPSGFGEVRCHVESASNHPDGDVGVQLPSLLHRGFHPGDGSRFAAVGKIGVSDPLPIMNGNRWLIPWIDGAQLFAVVRGSEVEDGAERDDLRRVDFGVRHVVVPLDVVQVHRRGDAGRLI
jgi:hypothetical protein